MNLEIIKSNNYTKVLGGIITQMTATPKEGTVTSHKMPFIFFYNFDYSNQINDFGSVKEDQLTQMCMLISEESLAKDWENEDDERWNQFLINE